MLKDIPTIRANRFINILVCSDCLSNRLQNIQKSLTRKKLTRPFFLVKNEFTDLERSFLIFSVGNIFQAILQDLV